MHTQLQYSSYLLFLITAYAFVGISASPHMNMITDDERFKECSHQFECGKIKNITYPFWEKGRNKDCGLSEFELECKDHNPVMKIMSEEYRVLSIDEGRSTMSVVRMDFLDEACPDKFVNITIDHSLFDYATGYSNLSLFYNCSSPISPNHFTCTGNGIPGGVYYDINPTWNLQTQSCKGHIMVPISRMSLEDLWRGLQTLDEVLRRGFELKYKYDIGQQCSSCLGSGGQCGYNSSSNEFLCFGLEQPGKRRNMVMTVEAASGPTSSPVPLSPASAPTSSSLPPYPLASTPTSLSLPPHPPASAPTSSSLPPHPLGSRSKSLNTEIKVAVGLVIAVILFCCFMRKCSSCKSMIFWKKVTENHQKIEAFLKNYGSFAPKRYSYSEVKKMTNTFKEKLGQGGYGGVYKGNLHNGRLVAVKVLNESKGNGEEFINEVASITRTSHVNIVTLLGFCFEGPKRALIYEFMLNGSLEKFIYNEKSSKERQLGWETLYQIAVGIAQGLEYLHRGCNTRILHFDIKPHNILLDEDFCPKISDFGLAQLCPKKDSIISMLGMRGTAGYIAPEVFSRNFGEVSHKSDVYSYGMMILEMVGGRKNINVVVDHTSEIYFPHWIYKRLELGEEIELHGIRNEEDNENARKMIIVGLWCIQTDPSNRPSMSSVVDMLKRSLELLQIPPKPLLSSPPRPRADSSTT
uniref:non-specific serine/threonine protein kinase n=1 Tax=Davidia involucrata TaxID=16924 RepID=A0A5B6YRV3_DAVIN